MTDSTQNSSAAPRGDGPPTQRSLEGCHASVQVAPAPSALGTEDALRGRLEDAAAERGARWLFGYDDDGVLWGRFGPEGRLTTAREAVREAEGPQAAAHFPQLRPRTVQEVSLFGPGTEVKLWRSDAGRWQARYVTEPATESADYAHGFDEDHLLLGTYGKALGNGFTLVWEGRNRRHQHAVPAALRVGDDQRLREAGRLRVRTYVTGGPWHEPALKRLAGLVDASGHALAADSAEEPASAERPPSGEPAAPSRS